MALSQGQMYILNPMTLDIHKKMTMEVSTFAINPSDWIAFASGKKIFLYSFQLELGDLAPLTLGKFSEMSVSDHVSCIGNSYVLI